MYEVEKIEFPKILSTPVFSFLAFKVFFYSFFLQRKTARCEEIKVHEPKFNVISSHVVIVPPHVNKYCLT